MKLIAGVKVSISEEMKRKIREIYQKIITLLRKRHLNGKNPFLTLNNWAAPPSLIGQKKSQRTSPVDSKTDSRRHSIAPQV